MRDETQDANTASVARRPSLRALLGLFSVTVITVFAVCAPLSGTAQDQPRRLLKTVPEVALGDRLFFETRFAEYFFAHSKRDVNAPLARGDSVVDEVLRPGQRSLPGPFRGQSMSCRHCHLGDDFLPVEPLAQRTYSDFTPRSAIPQRNDKLTHTVRNSPIMVDLGLPAEVPRLLHLDGEFATAEDLVVETLTGRNMGWKFDEYGLAIAHIARVVREDNGQNARHVVDESGRGVPYSKVMLGRDPSVPPSLKIPLQYRLDVRTASDTEVVQAIARLIHAYMDSIRFGTEDTGRPSGSPYDLFLAKNHLPTTPSEGEHAQAYARRLLSEIEERTDLIWVTPREDGQFKLHDQAYQFGETELAGLKLFFREKGSSHGGCVNCHTPPQFTDHRFHNTGVSQAEYDALFGEAAFASLNVPDLASRNAQFDSYLPASRQHPDATSRFRSAPSKERPGFADLGVWNIFANPDFPKPQAGMTEILCATVIPIGTPCTQDAVSPLTIGLFKTPSIRDLGHSYPYFHSGAAQTIDDVLLFYVRVSALARAGRIRNASPELLDVHVSERDRASLAAFLKSLNEDYF
jgi:cytochrome c peroxidase